MKFIEITDLSGFKFTINPNQITRIEEYTNKIIVFLSDGIGINTSINLRHLKDLIDK